MEYKVSRETAELVKAYDLLSEVSNSLNKGLSAMYSDTRIEEMIDMEITPHIIKLQTVVMNWVNASIICNRGVIQSDEI